MALESGKMADTSQPLHPAVTWAQRKDRLFVTVNLEDCKNPVIDIKESQLHFKGKGGTENKVYEFTIELYQEVVPEDCRYNVLERNIPFVLKKKDDGEFWPRLTKDKVKTHWLKTDFNKWKDEDDSDYEESGTDLDAMMQQMGGMSGMPNVDDEEENDSDDEDLPDLE